MAKYLWDLDGASDVWKSIHPDFTKSYCFKKYRIEDIQHGEVGRQNAKEWFNSHLKEWGPNATKVINPWAEANSKDVEDFIYQFIVVYNKFAKELSIQSL